MRKSHPKELNILCSIPGIGRVLSLIILLEIGDINRFPTVQKFASYARPVKCSHESAGKKVQQEQSVLPAFTSNWTKWVFHVKKRKDI